MSEKLPGGPQFPEGEKFIAPTTDGSGSQLEENTIAREACARLGDQFRKLGLLDKAIEYYKKAKDEDRLVALKREFIESGDIKRAEKIAIFSDSEISDDDYEGIANKAFKNKDTKAGYLALERAGYNVEKADELNNYSAIWKKEGVDLAVHSKRLLDLGAIHEGQESWYEARSRYEDVLRHSKKLNDAHLQAKVRARLSSLGRKCVQKKSLFNAFLAFKVAESTLDLKQLSKEAILKEPRMESLALWIEEELIELEAKERKFKQDQQNLVSTKK